jgi:hypothetical protein
LHPTTQAKNQKFISLSVQILQTIPKLHWGRRRRFPCFPYRFFSRSGFYRKKRPKKPGPPLQAWTLVTHATNKRTRAVPFTYFGRRRSAIPVF